ncbi:MAG TPA: DUF5808 domain-containing protein [Holophagaceae bacterium]|nr:DUF5808 domain-containing protein [Holophagaceae bacterium]
MTEKDRLTRWDLLPLAGLLALAAFTLHVWGRLPDPLPAHWEAGWRPNGWLPKDSAVCFMFGVPVGMWIFIRLIAGYAVSSDEWKADIQLRAMRPLRALLCAGLCILMSLTVTIPLYGPAMFWPTAAAFLAFLGLGIGLMVLIVERELPAEHRHLYKGGLLYYNPEDPRLWVEKLIGIGWTLNFARPAAWLVMALLLAFPLAAALAAVFGR